MKRLVLTLVALLSIAPAIAHEGNHNSMAEAYQHAAAREAAYTTFCVSSLQAGHVLDDFTITEEASLNRFVMTARCYRSSDGSQQAIGPENFYWPAGAGCASGEVFDREALQCVNAQARCLAKNDDRPANDTGIFTGQKCVDGCTYGARTGKTGTASAGTVTIIYGSVGYTGETCSDPDPDVEPEPAGMTCSESTGTQMTMCIRSDGQHCFSADGQGGIDTGQMLCWEPGETGEKSANDVIQKRVPGNPTPFPSPTPPPGETTTPSTGPTTTDTTTPGGTNINSSVMNFTTNNGTDGPNQQGEPNDGSGGDGDEGDGETGSGGDGCETAPVCSDSGSIGCATLQQVWRSRCSKNGNKVGGGECGANGELLSFTCSGDEIACRQALIAGEAHCRSKKGDANADGLADALDIEGDGKGDMGSDGPGDQSVSLGVGFLDDSGFFGAPTCPTLGVIEFGVFGSFDLDAQPWLCDLTVMVRWTLALVGAFLAFCIIGGRTGF